jgi:23S rRNA pseudouridine2605 synthase
MAERLQKVLAASGVASRRQAEEWIRAGRVTVNGRPAELGQRVEDDDAIAVDGRRLRREKAAPAHLLLMYHRPAGEPLRHDAAAGEDEKAVYDRLPAARGRRWLPLSPLAPTDGGLELFTTDGDLRAAASRLAHELPIGHAVRVRGDVSEELVAGLAARAAEMDPPFTIDAARLAGGEGRNHWIELDTRGARGRELRALLLDAGLEVSRVMRTRFGPIRLDVEVPRARHRELPPTQRDALYDAVALPRPPRPGAAGGEARGEAKSGPSRGGRRAAGGRTDERRGPPRGGSDGARRGPRAGGGRVSPGSSRGRR